MKKSRNKILFLMHEGSASKILESKLSTDFDSDFYENVPWRNRPNSTGRLSVVNLKAIESLKGEFDITIRTDVVWGDHLCDIYSDFDIILLNSVSSSLSTKFNAELLSWKAKLGGLGPKVILGTEITWEARRNLGEIGDIDLQRVYFENLLLRHTARTDRRVYASTGAQESRVQEFEIGIDFSALPAAKPIEERKYISFVRAPEGRVTKNNEGIAQLVSIIEREPSLKGYNIREIAPPYTVTDYWKIMADSAFLLFTSRGETFSYAMNDAKALGVITLTTEQMYFTTIGHRFSVDTYPQIGIRYKDPVDAAQKLVTIANDKDLLRINSVQSMQSARRLFSLDAIRENFRKLLSGESLNTEGLYLYSDAHSNWDEVLRNAKLAGCRYVMPYLNLGPKKQTDLLADHDFEDDISFIRYFLNRVNESELRRVIRVTDGIVSVTDEGSIAKELDDETLSFLQLVCRSYKIGRVMVDAELAETVAFRNLQRVRVVNTVFDDSIPLQIWSRA